MPFAKISTILFWHLHQREVLDKKINGNHEEDNCANSWSSYITTTKDFQTHLANKWATETSGEPKLSLAWRDISTFNIWEIWRNNYVWYIWFFIPQRFYRFFIQRHGNGNGSLTRYLIQVILVGVHNSCSGLTIIVYITSNDLKTGVNGMRMWIFERAIVNRF